jgi:hypothetical protein
VQTDKQRPSVGLYKVKLPSFYLAVNLAPGNSRQGGRLLNRDHADFVAARGAQTVEASALADHQEPLGLDGDGCEFPFFQHTFLNTWLKTDKQPAISLYFLFAPRLVER